MCQQAGFIITLHSVRLRLKNQDKLKMRQRAVAAHIHTKSKVDDVKHDFIIVCTGRVK